MATEMLSESLIKGTAKNQESEIPSSNKVQDLDKTINGEIMMAREITRKKTRAGMVRGLEINKTKGAIQVPKWLFRLLTQVKKCQIISACWLSASQTSKLGN